MISLTLGRAGRGRTLRPVAKRRLDSLLAERGLYETRSRAAAAVMAGDVHVGARPAGKPGQLVAEDAELSVARPAPYVSRGGVKLEHGLDAFGLSPEGRLCLDVGASTGGFTDCLLQRGAAAVTALDVAYGELHWRIRQDPRVTVIERRNARSLDPGELPYRPDLIVVDVSFISLAKVLPAVLAAAAPELRLPGARQAAVRGRARAGRAGRRGALGRRPPRGPRGGRAARRASASGAAVLGYASSGLPGPAGNRESFVWLAEPGRAGGVDDLEAAARSAEP